MFEFNLTLVIQLLNFLALLFILKKLLYKPFFDIMDKRREKIEGEIFEAEKLRKEAEQLKKQAEEELRNARQRAEQIISAAEVEKEKIIEEAKEKAVKEAEKVIFGAQSEIERERQEALSKIQTLAAELSVSMAMKILKGALDDKAKKEYLLSILREYEK